MTHRFLIIALIVSALFNVGFIIGRTQSQPSGLTSEAHADAVDLVAKQLDLSPSQRSEFVELRRGFADNWEELQAQATLVRQELAEQFAADEPDMDRIGTLFEQSMEVEQIGRAH
ncbi:MAG: periplasmic heavy metal sensor, partial [Phycisphaerales bacterium JB038]